MFLVKTFYSSKYYPFHDIFGHIHLKTNKTKRNCYCPKNMYWNIEILFFAWTNKYFTLQMMSCTNLELSITISISTILQILGDFWCPIKYVHSQIESYSHWRISKNDLLVCTAISSADQKEQSSLHRRSWWKKYSISIRWFYLITLCITRYVITTYFEDYLITWNQHIYQNCMT